MRKKIFLFLLGGWLSLATLSAYADSLAKVNLIVFTHVNQQTINSEAFLHFLAKPDSKTAISLAPSYAPQANYRLYPAQAIGMNNAVSRLQNNGYHIVINQAWDQLITASSPWIHIVGGQAYALNGKPSSESEAAYWEIDGYIRISAQGGFIIDSNLFLTLPSSLNDNEYGLSPLRSYRLAGKQVLKFNQFGYLDHPLFGVLVYLTPKN